jgi:hypothetical protein
MKCYVLEQERNFTAAMEKVEVSSDTEQEILALCSSWQARDLHQEGHNTDDYEGRTLYDTLDAENFVVSNGRVVGYYAVHFDHTVYVPFPITAGKYHIGDYDYTDYRNNGRVNRGHVDIVPKPDTDLNPYHDVARFHSQEEYDDYIKWRD